MSTHSRLPGASAIRGTAACCAALALFCSVEVAPVFAGPPDTPLIYVTQDTYPGPAFGLGKLSIVSGDPHQTLQDIDGFINGPRLASDSAGNIYVTSYHSGTLTRYPPGGGAGTVLRRGLLGPVDVAVDRVGGIYIAEDGNANVSYFPPGNGQPVVIAKIRVQRLALDSDDNLYLTASEMGGVYKYAGSSLIPLVVGVRYPSGLAVDAAGNVFFSLGDTSDGRGPGIYQYVPGQEQPKRLVTGGEAYGLAVDASGTLYFTLGGSVYKRLVGESGVTFEVLAQGLKSPADLSVTPRHTLPSAHLRITSPDPQSSAAVTTEHPTIQGTGTPGAAVTVSIASVQKQGPLSVGSYVCNASVNDYGNWACESAVALTRGETFGILASAWALDGAASEARTNVFVAP